jgi:hypothetical protein
MRSLALTFASSLGHISSSFGTHAPWGAALPARIQCYVQSLFYLGSQSALISRAAGSAHFPPHAPRHRGYFRHLYSVPPWNPPASYTIFKFLYTLRFIVCDVEFHRS